MIVKFIFAPAAYRYNMKPIIIHPEKKTEREKLKAIINQKR